MRLKAWQAVFCVCLLVLVLGAHDGQQRGGALLRGLASRVARARSSLQARLGQAHGRALQAAGSSAAAAEECQDCSPQQLLSWQQADGDQHLLQDSSSSGGIGSSGSGGSSSSSSSSSWWLPESGVSPLLGGGSRAGRGQPAAQQQAAGTAARGAQGSWADADAAADGSATPYASTTGPAAAVKNSARPYTKTVSQVLPWESCLCWNPELCTCGMQWCPYAPPDEGVDLPSEAARQLYEADCLPNLQLSADVQARRSQRAPPLSPSLLQRFNKRISTQLIQPNYQFAREHYVLEGAKAVLAAGGNSFKFRLANEDRKGRQIAGLKTVLDFVRSPSLPFADLFDLPLTYYFFWVFPNYDKPYPDTYELAAYLMQRYAGTGKHFFFGMWEGDHALRKPGGPLGLKVPPEVRRIETIQFVVQEKQRAVDAAKRDFGGSCKQVYIWNYIEANLVINSVWNRAQMSVVNYLVPTIDDPPVDYISYSCYETIFERSDWKFQNLTAALDYMVQRLPPKPGVPGPRVFLGEWGFPIYEADGRSAWSPEQVRQKGLYAAVVSIAWGSQYNIYWQLYSNHKFANGTGDRGFWLVTSRGAHTPIWTNMQEFFAASDEFLRRFWGCYGGWPSDYTYRVWAVKTLMKLINNATLPEPVVRDLSSTSYGRQVKVVADGLYGFGGSSMTLQAPPSSVDPDASAAAASSAASYVPTSGGDGMQAPPMVPQPLPGYGTGGFRGRCPIPLSMLRPGVPVPSPSPKPPGRVNATGGPPGAATGGPPGAATGGPPGAAAGGGGSGSGGGGGGGGGAKQNEAAGAKQIEAAGKPGKSPVNATCSSWSQVNATIDIGKPDNCPHKYPKITWQDAVAGTSKPYTYGGIDRIGCANCQQKGLWPKFCLWRRTERTFWDALNCNQRENYGRASVRKNLEFSANLTRYWPASSGVALPKGAAGAAGGFVPGQGFATGGAGGAKAKAAKAAAGGAKLTPGPLEITPCDLWRLIRGRTLWIIGDSQMKGLFYALKCFMLEFWDLRGYAPSWNATINAYLDALPRGAEGSCIHMPAATRICRLKILWADVFAEQPAKGETRWTTPVMELLHAHLAAPDDIFALNFGLWYDPKNPARYYGNLVSLGQAYASTRARFPNVFFLETVKLHYPEPFGDQDVPPNGSAIDTCAPPTGGVEFDPRDASLRLRLPPVAAAGPLPGTPAAEAAMADGRASASDGGGRDAAAYRLPARAPPGPRRRLAWAAGGLQRLAGGWLGGEGGGGRWLLQEGGDEGLEQGQQAGGGDAAEAATGAAAAAAASVPAPLGANAPGGSGELLPEAASQAAAAQAAADADATVAPPPAAAASAGSPTQPVTRRRDGSGGGGGGGGGGSGGGGSASSSSTASPPRIGGDEAPIFQAQGDGSQTQTRNEAAAAATAASPAPAAAGGSRSTSGGSRSRSGGASGGASGPSSSAPAGATAAAVSGAAQGPARKPGGATATPELAAASVVSGLWRNQIARSVLRDTFDLGWVPIYNSTVPLHWAHRFEPGNVASPDCIHFCNPGAPQDWIAMLALAIATRVEPLQGVVADNRCLWGSQQVFDPDERGYV